MDEFSKNETKGVSLNEGFESISTNPQESTESGKKQESLPEVSGKGLYGIASDFVNTFEHRFATATFALIIVGYIVMASFGKNSVNLYQYFLVIIVGFIFYSLLKYYKVIFDSIKKLLEFPLYYIPVLLLISILLFIYFEYGKPSIYFYKEATSIDRCYNSNLIFKEAK